MSDTIELPFMAAVLWALYLDKKVELTTGHNTKSEDLAQMYDLGEYRSAWITEQTKEK